MTRSWLIFTCILEIFNLQKPINKSSCGHDLDLISLSVSCIWVFSIDLWWKMGVKLTTSLWLLCFYGIFIYINGDIFFLCAVHQHPSERSKKLKVMNELEDLKFLAYLDLIFALEALLNFLPNSWICIQE